MTARSPEDIDRLFAERMAAGDIDGVIALYEPTGALLSPEGVATTGPASIRAGPAPAAHSWANYPRPNGSSSTNSHEPSGCRRDTSTAFPSIVTGRPSGSTADSFQSL